MRIPNWHKKLWGDRSKQEETMMVFWWRWCEMCEGAYLECPKCGNNSCNAGHGEIDGVPCEVCWLSDQYRKLAVENNEYPKTPEEVDYYNNKLLARLKVDINGNVVYETKGKKK